jgi:signal transduction histidine kinase
VRDVSREVVLERRLRHAEKMEALGRLAGGIAHDFNNLLGVMLAVAEAAVSDPGALADLRATAVRAAELVRELTVYSRPGAAEAATFTLEEAVDALEGLLRRTAGPERRWRRERGAPAGPVRAVRSEVERVLLNLVANARDATPAGGSIVTGTGAAEVDAALAEQEGVAPGRYASVSVADTGTGIAPEVARRIFEPYFTTKGPDRGTGLGLAMADKVVRDAGGFIRLRSTPGQGAAFTVFLPVVGA